MDSNVPILERAKDFSRYQPLTDFVLIRRINDTVDITGGGIRIPEIAQQQSNKGEVIDIGEGRIVGGKIEPIPLEKGDVVLFSKYAGDEIELDGVAFVLVKYDELKLKERRILV